jgi:ubiquitin-protein ligase
MSYGRDQILREDFERLVRLRDLSGGRIELKTEDALAKYLVTLHCTGLCLRHGSVTEIGEHRVQVLLGPSYPIQPPRLVWTTPIFHPNILAWEVCLVGQRWGAKTRLDEVCLWLWDMARYKLYNLDDPLDRNAKLWAEKHEGRFPTDRTDLRALVAAAAQPGREMTDEELAASIRLESQERS